MNAPSSGWSRRWLWLSGLVALVILAAIVWPRWSGWVSTWTGRTAAGSSATEHHDEADGHGHAHGQAQADAAAHAGGGQRAAIELSPQARENLGLTAEYLKPIELSTYRRSITLPAVIVPKPGRSQVVVASPLSGIVTHVHAVGGQAVLPGDLLMEIKLTYEDLVETQAGYLKTISELAVENREIARLEEATRSGAVSGKSLLERRYAKEKLDASLRAQREALRMHGLSERQVEAIGTDGRLLKDLQIVAPDIDRHSENEELRLSNVPLRSASFSPVRLPNGPAQNSPAQNSPTQNSPTQNSSAQPSPAQSRSAPSAPHDHPLVVDDLRVHKGQAVTAGEKLCSLSDYSELFIEGKAFEQDIGAISQAAERGWTIDAVFSGASGTETLQHLKLVFVSNAIDEVSRTLSLFVDLPNAIVRDETNAEGQRYISWKYRLGQRLELQVPIELWEGQFVVPIDAVVKEGADWFVFQQNGSRFDRVPVHVRYRDQRSVVIANDGSIYPGDVIALKSAHQLQMAIKNKSGGGVDPHAGHHH